MTIDAYSKLVTLVFFPTHAIWKNGMRTSNWNPNFPNLRGEKSTNRGWYISLPPRRIYTLLPFIQVGRSSKKIGWKFTNANHQGVPEVPLVFHIGEVSQECARKQKTIISEVFVEGPYCLKSLEQLCLFACLFGFFLCLLVFLLLFPVSSRCLCFYMFLLFSCVVFLFRGCERLSSGTFHTY